MTQVAQPDTEPCNTDSRARNWFGTWNNYPMSGMAQIVDLGAEKYMIGKEVGKNGTPHLQFCISFKNPRRFGGMKKDLPEVHWEVAKNWDKCWNYCKKEGDYICHPPEDPEELEKKEKNLEEQYNEFMHEEYDKVVWRPWQQKIIDLMATKPDKRKVYWFWENTGNSGKSWLGKYLEWKYDTIIVNGKQADVFNGIRNFLENRKKYPKLVIIDIPRMNLQYVCYSSMEKIKDGLFYSGKYEGGTIRLLPCHLVVFANEPPDAMKMSLDRWEVYEIPPMLDPKGVIAK